MIPTREMDAAISQLQVQDNRERVAAVQKLQAVLDRNQKSLNATDVGNLLNATVDLLKDRDHEVCQGALHVLASAASLAGDRLQLDFMALLPAIIDRLGDDKQSVRDAGRGLLLALMQIFSPTMVIERISTNASQHYNCKVREEFVRVLDSAIRLFSLDELPVVQLLLPVVLDLAKDPNSHVKEATMKILEKLYQKKGDHFKDEIRTFSLRRPGQIDSKVCTCGPKVPSPVAGMKKQLNENASPAGSYLLKHGPSSNVRSTIAAPSATQLASPSFQLDVHLDGSDHDGVSVIISEPRVADNNPDETQAQTRQGQSCCNATQDPGEPCCISGMISLDETLAESLSKTADWSVRVGAFSSIKKFLHQGSKGLSEIHQCFDSIIRLLRDHLTDAHFKVSQAALSIVVDLVKACKKGFGVQLDLMLPLLFPRLVDSRDETCELAAAALQAIGNTYDIKILFPAILRSLDEQRSPKGKVAVIEYAIGAFVKLEFNYEVISPLLRLWLSKLVTLSKSRHPKVKETSLMGIIAVYSHLDTIIVLEFILALPVDEQTALRRSLKQYVPQIEVDLVDHMRFRSHRAPLVTMEETDMSAMRKSYMHVFPAVKNCDNKPPNPNQMDRSGVHEGMVKELRFNCRTPQNSGDLTIIGPKIRDSNTGWDINCDKTRRWLDSYSMNVDVSDGADTAHLNPDTGSAENNVTRMLTERVFLWGPDKTLSEKHEALLAAARLHQSSDTKVWSQYFHKLISTVLEAAKDSDKFTRELALSIIPDILKQIVKRLPKEMLVERLPTFLPVLVEAFKHQQEDVRQAVLFSLVDIYVVIGKNFLPYLSGLNGTQLQLITNYASHMTQGKAMQSQPFKDSASSSLVLKCVQIKRCSAAP